jgi:hypothetical protein
MIPMDIPDGNPGKMMAQAAHAQALFTREMNKRKQDFSDLEKHKNIELTSSFLDSYEAWLKEGDGFGTTIVLSCLIKDIRSNYASTTNLASGRVIDPTYPWRNFYGELFVKEQLTAGWVFVTTEEEAQFFSKCSLYR